MNPTSDSAPSAPDFVPVGTLFELALGGLALVLGLVVGIRPASTLYLSWQDVGAGALAALPLFAVLALSLRSGWTPLRRIREWADRELLPLVEPASLAGLALLSGAAGLGEELLFRGLIQGGLESWRPGLPALLLAAAVFGLAHPFTPTYAALVAGIGLYLGLLWQATGSLLVVATAHAVYDFGALVVLRRRARSLRRVALQASSRQGE